MPDLYYSTVIVIYLVLALSVTDELFLKSDYRIGPAVKLHLQDRQLRDYRCKSAELHFQLRHPDRGQFSKIIACYLGLGCDQTVNWVKDRVWSEGIRRKEGAKEYDGIK